MGVERWERAPNGGKPKKQKEVTNREPLSKEGPLRKACGALFVREQIHVQIPGGEPRPARGLRIQCRAKHGNKEMRKMRSALVHLQPTHHTMIGEVFSDAGFRNAQMLGQLRLDGCFPAACGSPPQ